MRRWWLRPLVRLLAALALPVLVPAVISLLIWALPGDPASIICPPELCGGTESLAARWHLDEGPWKFYSTWLSSAIQGDFGNSWRVLQGAPVAELLAESIPNTLLLLAAALVPVSIGVLAGAAGWIPPRLDGGLYLLGVIPALVLSLLAAALLQLSPGGGLGSLNPAQLLAGAAVLGLADGAFSGTVTGTRGLFQQENQQRYVGVALLRGEGTLANTLPNVTPALAGQIRARLLHLLSGLVVVEVILKVPGLGDLIWEGALKQDFGVVMAAATCFAVLSAGLLFVQALVEIAVAWHVRRAPAVRAAA